MARFFRTVGSLGLSAALLLAAQAGCPQQNVKKGPGAPDPDTNSGPDAKQSGAKVIQAKRDGYNQNRLIFNETDSVSWPKLMRTKWKRIDLEKPGLENTLDCELRIDNAGADLNLDLYNSLGTQIGFSPGPAPNKLKKLNVSIEDVGTYFVRVQAAQPKDESDFSVFCSWEERPPGAPPPPPKVGKGPKPPTPTPTPTPTPSPVEELQERIDNGLEGRVVQAYKEGGKMMLNLDKGSAAGVKVGTEGYVLSGPSGKAPLDGAKFRVRKVIDDTHSVGEADLRSIGRNNRVVFFVK